MDKTRAGIDRDGAAVGDGDGHVGGLIGAAQGRELKRRRRSCQPGAPARRAGQSQRRGGAAGANGRIGRMDLQAHARVVQRYTHAAPLRHRGLLRVAQQAQGFVVETARVEITAAELGRGKHRQHTHDDDDHDEFDQGETAFGVSAAG